MRGGASLLEADNYCYRPSGFLQTSRKVMYRQLNDAGHVCDVVSPAHTPRRAGRGAAENLVVTNGEELWP